jgi:NADPH:quinone reductase-like Zn-dependent oxidoreductase
MKAYICRRYGGPDVVELADVPTPVPSPGEILVKIRATTVTAGDWRVRTLNMPKGLGLVARPALGFTRPRQPILGTELAGTVAAVGTEVTRFKPGDAVFAFPGGKMGCHAQYRTMPENGAVALKPENLSFEEAAALSFGAMTALDFLRKASLKAGDQVLVIGASGNVGTAMVQLARHFGAVVTGVTSTANLALVASLGAVKLIDYTKEDITNIRDAYDVIADTVGASAAAKLRPALKPGGRLLAIAGGLPEMLATLWTPLTSRKVIAGPAAERPAYLQEIAELAKTGALKPVIDRRYTFAQMREAHAYVETGRKKGSVVVTVEHDR